MENKKRIIIGCIADDFTGGSDAASFLEQQGISTILFNGIPGECEIPDGVAVVIALKSRSIESGAAVEQTSLAAGWLLAHGAKRLYFKYCSTFDSTPKGNIGPVADAMMEQLQIPYTLLCPSLPVNGRTVKKGHLYVEGTPLHETHMQNHPLNPMWSSYLPKLMEPQSKYPCFVLESDLLYQSEEEIWAYIQTLQQENQHFYLIPDYQWEEDGRRIAEVFQNLRFITGGSHLAGLWGGLWEAKQKQEHSRFTDGTEGKALILSGSCSKATREQIAAYEKSGKPVLYVAPADLKRGQVSAESVWEQIRDSQMPVLVCTQPKNDGEEEDASVRLEAFMAELAELACQNGVRRLIVAGGETSGAVALKLGFASFYIGSSVAAGVPIMIPVERPEIRIVLKSGNFGQQEFFGRALEMTGVSQGQKGGCA